MIVTYKWLSDFVDLSDMTPQAVADKFTLIGYEVDEMRVLSKGMERVVVGKIERLTRHPNAERLQICAIDIGQKKHLQILTAATNVFEGALVPVALDGANLPNGVMIKTSLMRGEESQGMLCSGEELCIGNDVYDGAEVDGIMILNPQDCKIGDNIATVLGMDDVVYDISVLSNRPDCQSVKGLAKELAAALNRPVNEPNFKYRATNLNMPLNLEIKTDNCPFYVGCVIRDVKLGPSPKWMQNRLRLVGLRPINNIVDITNYVLWEMGQPMHAFDYDKLNSETIIVRQAKDGEKLQTLNDETYELTPNMMVIADAIQPVGLAGIMGGKQFSISKDTKNIVLESVVFNRENIRKTARSLGIRSDASARNERGVEPVSAVAGLDRALALIQELKVGKINNEIVSNTSFDTKGRVITFKLGFIKDLLGIDIPEMDIVRILGNLGIVTTIKNNKVNCIVPTIRTDIIGPADIVEELIRMYGYEHIESTNLQFTSSTRGGLSIQQKLHQETVDLMLATGAHQIITYTFTSPTVYDKILMPKDSDYRNAMEISNPLSHDYSIMRTQMFGSMIEAVELNNSRKNKNYALFELGKTFIKPQNDTDLPNEKIFLSYIDTRKDVDFFKLKSIVERFASNHNLTFVYKPSNVPYLHPNICADIMFANRAIGHIGKVHPRVLQNYGISSDVYYFEICLDNIPAKKVKKVKPVSRFPYAERDLAVVVDEDTPVGDMHAVIHRVAGEYLEDAELFDVYQGNQIDKGSKSVAWRLIFRKLDGTLSQEEVNATFEKILNELSKRFEAKLR